MGTTRRSPGRGALLAILGLVVASACAGGADDEGSESAAVHRTADGPNFVVVLLDDLDETITPYWDALSQTRNLLADRGLRITNAFAPAPICCPARAVILTGPPHEYELYDLTADPYQTNNLLAVADGSVRWADAVASLEQRLNDLAECSGASCR